MFTSQHGVNDLIEADVVLQDSFRRVETIVSRQELRRLMNLTRFLEPMSADHRQNLKRKYNIELKNTKKRQSH